jgi:pimeloyl-ACP methyl ester carboxylesterase
VTLPAGVRPTRIAGLASLVADPDRSPAGLAVVCVPGFTGSKEDFGQLLPLLAAGGHRAVAIDQRGQYESAADARGNPPGWGTDALAADLRAVLDEVRSGSGGPQGTGVGSPRGRVHVVGHSYGGIVARRTALADTTGIASLTLLGSGPAAIGGQRAKLIELMRPVLAEGGMAAVFEASEAVAAAARDGPDERPPEVVAFLRERFLATDPVALEAMGDALLTEADLVAELAAVGVPLLVAHGEGDDAWPPPVQQEMARRLGAPCGAIANALHSPAAENPEQTAEVLLDFFAGLGE